MLRRLLVAFVILLVVLVVVADRVGAVVAAHVLAEKVQTDEHLASRPDASIGGIPFLTQAFEGRYSDVSVTAHGVVTDGLVISQLTVHLHGVHVSASDVLHGSVNRVPVDRVDGRAVVSYADANRYLAGQHLSVSPASGGQLRVTRTVSALGQTLKASGVGHATVSDNTVRVSVTQVAAQADQFSAAHLSLHVNVSFPLHDLPFRISLGSVTAGSSGIVATGTARHIVLGGS